MIGLENDLKMFRSIFLEGTATHMKNKKLFTPLFLHLVVLQKLRGSEGTTKLHCAVTFYGMRQQ